MTQIALPNPLITPTYIQPEYLLFAYAILDKLRGIILLLSSVIILYISKISKMNKILKSNSFYPINQIIC